MLRSVFLAAVLVCAAAGLAGAQQQLAPLPPQPAGIAWPTAEWASAPLPENMDRPAFDLAMTEAFAGVNEGYGETRAVLIVQHGRIVFERYAQGYGPNMRLISWSMAKSVTQALVGAAVLQGRVSIDAPMGNPGWSASDRRAAITWRQWLNMVDGQQYHEIGADTILSNTVTHLLYGEGRGDTARFAAGLPIVHDPGTHWNYNSAGIVLVADALTRTVVPNPRNATDRRDRMRAWMDQSLFTPIGMHPIVEFDPAGTFYGSALVWATARDFARFGYLYLRNGVWDGHRLLPEGWVDFARTRGPDAHTDVYGAGWWLTPSQGVGQPMHSTIRDNALADTFSAQGHEGQMIVVVPSRDMVLVRLGHFDDALRHWDALGDWLSKVIEAFPATPAPAAANGVTHG
jgi:CubicO group peptidase (beta-lactamase class C family)